MFLDAIYLKLRPDDERAEGVLVAWGVTLEGWAINRKPVQRLWREEVLRVARRRRKRQRLGDSTVPADRLRADRAGHVWALGFQFDQTADGRVLKLLTSSTRGSLRAR